MIMRNLPPKPCRKVPPLPYNSSNPVSEKNIDPEIGFISGHSKNYSKKILARRQLSMKSLNSQRALRPTSASSLKSRQNSKESMRSESSIKDDEPLMKSNFKLTSLNWGIFQMKSKKYLTGLRTSKRREFASLTKIMNFITILNLLNEFELSPSKVKVIVSESASKMIGTTAEIKNGMVFTLEDLFYGMMLPSGNDAAYQIAQVGGAIIKLCREEKRKKQLVYSEQFLFQEVNAHGRSQVIRYLSEMNKLSQKLGLTKSKWSNPHGLSNRENFSTVNDLGKLCTFAMRNKDFRKVVNTKEYCCVAEIRMEVYEDKENLGEKNCGEVNKVMNWVNTNKMLDKGWNGLKTGITPNAGPCLAATVEKNIKGEDYEFLVILGSCQSMNQRWEEVQQLVDWAIENKKQWESLISC